MYIFQKIEEQSVHYNDARKNIAEFLLNERSHAENYSMSDIAGMTYTSKATLTRFAKGIGYSGWIEFMEDFLKEAHYQETHFSDIDPNMPFTQADNTEEMIRKLAVLQTEALRDTADLMKASVIEEAAKRIMSSDQAALFGLSPHTIIMQLFCRKMESIGKLCICASPDEGGMISRALGQDDCAIIVSYSGNNTARIPMRYVSALKEKKVKMIAITSQGKNYLRDEIDCVISLSSREKLYSKIANYATEESLEFIFNVLFSKCFAMDFKKNYEYKIGNSKVLESTRSTTLNEMKEDH